MKKGDSPLVYLITGVTGQDGFLAARYFLKKGGVVFGVSRKPGSVDHDLLRVLLKHPRYYHVHFTTYTFQSIQDLIKRINPDRILHCAGYRDIPKTKDEVVQCYTTNCDILQMLCEVAMHEAKNTRLIFLSSAEVFKREKNLLCDERSIVAPSNEYGVSKLKGMEIIDHYRRRDLFCMSAICFNHDSCLSPLDHLARLVPYKLLKLGRGAVPEVRFYNVEIKRDWSHARDFVRAFEIMLERDIPEDLVVSSGYAGTLKQYIEVCCAQLSISHGVKFDVLPEIDSYDRVADPSRLKHLGWVPEYDMLRLGREMIGWEKKRMSAMEKR